MGDFSRMKQVLTQMGDKLPTSRHRDSNVLIIDGMNTFIRVFSVVPALNDNGEHIGGVAGFLRSISNNIRQFNATRCIIVFDGSGGSLRRRKIFKDYKMSRKSNMTFNRHEEFQSVEDEKASMKRQFARIGEYLQYLPVTTVMLDNIEADDSIAFMVRSYFRQRDSNVVIVSSDRDYLQLVSDKVTVWSPVKKKLYDKALVEQEYGLHQSNYLLYRVMTGDSSDNIPGVRGMGLKTILKHFPQLIEIPDLTIQDLAEWSMSQQPGLQAKKGAKLPAVHSKLLDSLPQLELNHQLMQLQEVDISSFSQNRLLELADAPPSRFDRTLVKRLAYQDGLGTYIKDVDLWLREGFNMLQQYANIK